ncbi:hypothetical protein [Kineococcus sp. SYSU DK003]|uniref:hypothetical protein n=1 Tax=Kineococcus sp. SYSU DK003 TaxID=3383124 RepID=UPI003D7D6C27
MTHGQPQVQFQAQVQSWLSSQPSGPSVQGYRPRRSQAQRHADTAAAATRRTAPWTLVEDEELSACASADDLEAFALRWSRTFRAVEQRRRRPRRVTVRTGTGWV